MFLMAPSTAFLTAFLSLEMVSIMSYILSAFKRRNRQSSEASLKYVVYGGVASGVMLYGMSLLYGFAGSTSLAAIYAKLSGAHASATPMATTAGEMCLARFGAKIAAVPLRVW